MLELELKSLLPDLDDTRRRLTEAGAAASFVGRLEDRRYDTPRRDLAARDHVLRVRVYRPERGEARTLVDWKGPTSFDRGYKRREELSTPIGDVDAFTDILGRLGYGVSMAIDRRIWQFELRGATVRLERYPRMDDLVEVEGTPATIEGAIGALALPREGFTAERLADFVRRYEERTGQRALLSDIEGTGRAYDVANA